MLNEAELDFRGTLPPTSLTPPGSFLLNLNIVSSSTGPITPTLQALSRQPNQTGNPATAGLHLLLGAALRHPRPLGGSRLRGGRGVRIRRSAQVAHAVEEGTRRVEPTGAASDGHTQRTVQSS